MPEDEPLRDYLRRKGADLPPPDAEELAVLLRLAIARLGELEEAEIRPILQERLDAYEGAGG